MRIPIAVKLIVMTCVLLLGVAIPIALKSSALIAETSSKREESVNTDFSKSKAIEVDQLISNIREKTQTMANILYKLSQQGEDSSPDLEQSFQDDKKLYSLMIYRVVSNNASLIVQKAKDTPLLPFKLKTNYYSNLRQWQKFPFQNVVKEKGEFVIINSTFPKGPAIITLGFPLIRNEINQITHVAVIDVDMSAFQKSFSEKKEQQYFLVDKNGILLADQDEFKAMAKIDLSHHPLIEKALDSDIGQFQKSSYIDPETENEYLGAFQKTANGPIVVSQIARDTFLAPARELKRQAFFTAGLLISGSLFFVFLFSLSLSSPVETLAELVEIVSKGNFNVKAKEKIKGFLKDEVSDLAIAFDNMTEGLKERDKVKSLFSKFHGSSVTDDLLHQDIALGGKNKEVAVFFSDVRGFTAFSEKRSPEEVVEMLNEYFGAMVKIINQNGGVVDKFIGDAIMAVWGAPRSTSDDTQKAVKACLEMRVSLAELNAVRATRGQPALQIGMGLHYGRAISGTIGSSERMEYTVIGNTVNTASRIEASTKAFGSDLLISQDVVDKIGDQFWIEQAGSAEVKGRSEPLVLYKVRGYKDASGQIIEVKTEFSEYKAEHADKVKISA